MAHATSALRSLAARIGGLSLAATHDPLVYTAPARRAFLSRFEREVDPEGTLPIAERQRRAEAARKAYFTRLALKSAVARRRRRHTAGGASDSCAAPERPDSDKSGRSPA